ncbi:MAG TPA: hypothetical protein VGW30_07635 [Gaiellaceae bacterium]|nr:hypothetical protein [Gaiellaceae bacterium]
MSTDEIRLTMPRKRPYYGVAHLVLGGVAARLDITVEHLEDLELALDGLLDRRDGAEEVTLTLRVLDGSLAAELGPFGDQLRADFANEPDEGLSIRRLLDAVVDSWTLEERDGGTWIELQKQTRTNGSG